MELGMLVVRILKKGNKETYLRSSRGRYLYKQK